MTFEPVVIVSWFVTVTTFTWAVSRVETIWDRIALVAALSGTYCLMSVPLLCFCVANLLYEIGWI